ncbi:LysM peptidoglycan-binding domain-containing protein [Patescibacteria group bacterium]|nr:LysM peptidoglycan-binding domain-containing protein [Patescibacteria group bacterium]
MSDQQNLLQTNESRLTTTIIAVLLIMGGFMIYSFLRNGGEGITSELITPAVSTEAEIGESAEETEEAVSAYTYIVQAGDSLWRIAKEKLGDGFAWKELAQVNNIPEDNPVIRIGQELIIGGFGGPVTQEGDVLSSLTAEKSEEGEIISTEHYTVKKGDTLWTIAEKFYGNGAEWHKLFEAPENNLSLYTTATTSQTFPLIHPGNVLVIP